MHLQALLLSFIALIWRYFIFTSAAASVMNSFAGSDQIAGTVSTHLMLFSFTPNFFLSIVFSIRSRKYLIPCLKTSIALIFFFPVMSTISVSFVSLWKQKRILTMVKGYYPSIHKVYNQQRFVNTSRLLISLSFKVCFGRS